MSNDDTNDDALSDEERITEEDAVVQTPHGERYRASEISKGGRVRGEDD